MGGVALILSALGVMGCDATTDLQARNAYDEGRYLDAAERLERAESGLAALPPERRARYGLYRGLSLLRLGEVEGARRWLEYVELNRQLVARLADHERRKLREGLIEARAAPTASRPSEPAKGEVRGRDGNLGETDTRDVR